MVVGPQEGAAEDAEPQRQGRAAHSGSENVLGQISWSVWK